MAVCRRIGCLSTDDSVEPLLEPRNAVLLLDLVLGTDSSVLVLPSGNSHTGSAHDDVEVHTEDTDTRVVLDTQVDVLVDTESEVTSLAEVSLLQLVLLDLQSTLQDLLGLGSSDGDVTGDLFVSSNREGSDGVSGLGGDGRLTGELLQHLGGSGEPVSRLSDSDVDDQLLDVKVLHGVGGGGLLSLIRSKTNLSVSARSLCNPSYRHILHRIRPCSRSSKQGLPWKGLFDRLSFGFGGNTPGSIQLDRL